MFHQISPEIQRQMRRLEEIDIRDRTDNTPRYQRLRQVPPDAGKFTTLLAASAPQGEFIEIGTSGGYSTLWLSLACRMRGQKITTFEVLEEKASRATETFHAAGVEDVIELVLGDARDHLPNYRQVAFCFLDAEKEVYADCYEVIIPNMVSGGLLVADNTINHQVTLQPMLDRTLNDERVDAVNIPLGNGLLVCRKI